MKNNQKKSVAQCRRSLYYFVKALKFNSAYCLAIALLIALSFTAYAGDVVVQSGTIDVDSKLFVDPGTSNVGIGTIIPAYKLDVLGDIYSSAYVRGAAGLCIASDCRTTWPIGGGNLPSGTLGQTIWNDGTNWVVSSLLNNTGTDNIKIQNNNEVYLDLRNTEIGGREWALVSAGSAGGIGRGNFSIYDKTAGISRLAIDANGNVGIGTTSPASPLNIMGNSGDSNTGTLILGPTSGTNLRMGYNTIGGYSWIQSHGGQPLRINELGNNVILNSGGGNVGIGTTIPGTKLDVVGGTIRGDTGLTITSGVVSLPASQIDNSEIANPSLTVTAGSGLSGGGAIALGGSASLSLNTANANTWTAAQTYSANTNFPGSGIWNSAGSVGVGTLSPFYSLDLNGAMRLQPISQPATLNNGLIFYDSTAGKFKCYEAGALKDCIAASGAGSSQWTTSGSNIYYNLGNVGIATALPLDKLHIASTWAVNQNAGIRFSDNGNNWPGWRIGIKSDSGGIPRFFIGLGGDAIGTDRITMDQSGNVGIGNPSPAAKLDVNGIVNAACPSGMTDAVSYCIETTQRTASNWDSAGITCGDRGKRLCSAFEWRYACNKFSTTTMPDMISTNNKEWTDDSTSAPSGGNPVILILGGTFCTTTATVGASTVATQPFRCCVDKRLSST